MSKYYCANAPYNSWFKADLSFVIELLVGIIPIPHLEQGLHQNTCHIFQSCSTDTSGYKYKYNIVIKRLWYHKHRYSAATIKRNKRSSHETSVRKTFLHYSNVGGLKAPSKKAVEVEKKHPLQRKIIKHKLFLSLKMYSTAL